ncbi:MAG: hypothetical protein Q8K63_10065 [Acidimicrobiales bacterium]|nr:hypothetical protein [Acidimicrobiales bacterium]
MSDDELRSEIARCRAQERAVKPNKARRSWKALAEAAEEELDRRTPPTYASPEEVRIVEVTYSDEANAIVMGVTRRRCAPSSTR